MLGALGDSAGGPASPAVESGEDYVNVPESEESADVSLGEWPVPPRVPLPSPTLTAVALFLSVLFSHPPRGRPPF